MKVEQLYTGCLAQGAYYIRSGQEAAIIDPLREVEPYLERAKADGVTIRYIFETHFHADFVSGHIDLADATGATIVYGPGAEPRFDAYVAHDGEVLRRCHDPRAAYPGPYIGKHNLSAERRTGKRPCHFQRRYNVINKSMYV